MGGQGQLQEDRERFFKRFFYIVDLLKAMRDWLESVSGFIFVTTTVLFFLSFIFFIGFSVDREIRVTLGMAFRHFFIILAIAKFLPEFLHLQFRGFLSVIFRTALLILVLAVLYVSFVHVRGDSLPGGFRGNGILIVSILMIILSESARFFNFISRMKIPPAMIFSGSFLIIIFTGSGLLMLPKAHTMTLTYFDALFTSVSAVCVTGLVVVDTSTAFTQVGKIIILCLIQIGGLGIMTFTGFFSYIFTSGSTFQERLILKDFLSAESLGNLFKVLIKIVLFTFIIELAGAGIIYLSIPEMISEGVFFSVFHAVSAFCNAGFSTLTGGLNSDAVRSNILMQSSVALLIILGGIGFPVLLKLYSLTKHLLKSVLNKLLDKKMPVLQQRMDIGGRLVLRTSLFLIISGTVMYYLLEGNYSNYGLNQEQSLFNSLFNSVTARTAGFNVIDLTTLGYPAVFLTIILMWIGASPGSTGGGIKTPTISIAIRAAWGVIRGRSVLEIHNREISHATINRVLSIIILSLLAIGTSFFILLITDSGKDPVYLLYECVSAFSTVGLSIADTATFSQAGKLILIVLMFTGRVGLITLLMSFFKSRTRKYHSYPEGEIYIN